MQAAAADVALDTIFDMPLVIWPMLAPFWMSVAKALTWSDRELSLSWSAPEAALASSEIWLPKDFAASAFCWFVLSDEVRVEARFLTSVTRLPHAKLGEADTDGLEGALEDAVEGAAEPLVVDDPQPATAASAIAAAKVAPSRDDGTNAEERRRGIT